MVNDIATTATAPITLTAGAVEQLLAIRSEMEGAADLMLRVGVKGGGCSGFTYVLGFDEKQEGDEVFEISGIPVVMKKAHALYVMGMEIDFVNGLDNRGFKYNNPNATDTCGCGTSFSA